MIFQAGRFGFRASLSPLTFEVRSNVSDPDRWLVEYAGGHPTASGMTITERTAMQISAVFCAVDLVSNDIAMSPLQMFEKKDSGRYQVKDHPVARVLKQPNEEMTAITFRKVVQAGAMLWGNGYAEIERNGAGQVVALWPLRPDRTFPRRLKDGRLVYAARSDNGQEVQLPAHNVLHVIGYTFDGLRGLSTIALHRETLGLSAATSDYGARFFGNDARPGGMLKTAGVMKKEARDRIKESWEEAHRGGAKAFRVFVGEQGLEWVPMAMPNEDAQFLQTRVFQIAEVARMYHVPLHKLSELSHATFSNIEHQGIEYRQDGVMPWACGWEEEIERKLLNPAEQDRFYVEHNLDSLVRGDMESRYKSHQIAIQTGMRSPDDIGELENWNPQPNGQGKTYWMLSTIQPVAKALAPAEPKPVPNDPNKVAQGDGQPMRNQAVHHAGLALAYAGVLEVVGERLARKETAALSRIFSYNSQSRVQEIEKFFYDHRSYVEEALTPALARCFQSVGSLYRSPLKDIPEEYVATAADTYIEQSRAALKGTEAIAAWSSAVGSRSLDQAIRAVNTFAIAHYKAMGIAKLVLVRDDREQCEACQAQPVEAFDERLKGIPPFRSGCRCQVVAAE